MPPITGILFDSGDVLMRPLGGRWWPKPALAAWLDESPSTGDVGAALAAGMAFLIDNHDVPDEDAEVAVFTRYYEVVLGVLGDVYPASLPGRLGRAAVEEADQEPFPDTGPVLVRLREAGVRLGVVSNAWPSLRRRYVAAGVDGLFDAFVVSAEAGRLKPDPAIYDVALAAIGLPPGDVLFVDDEPEYVTAAEALGMRGLVLDRAVAGLAEVEAVVAGG